uniref:Velvet domain-containing protein n=1 Tax=Angiostrongylus cantonensis TaxID=6313 RepID=A0A0K0DPR9_ANGCA
MVPFIDTTRPPPAVSSITGHVNPSQVAAVPLAPVGRGYYNPPNVIPSTGHHQLRHNISQQQQQQQAGLQSPVMSIYPPGSLTAAMRGDPGGVSSVLVVEVFLYDNKELRGTQYENIEVRSTSETVGVYCGFP